MLCVLICEKKLCRAFKYYVYYIYLSALLHMCVCIQHSRRLCLFFFQLSPLPTLLFVLCRSHGHAASSTLGYGSNYPADCCVGPWPVRSSSMAISPALRFPLASLSFIHGSPSYHLLFPSLFPSRSLPFAFHYSLADVSDELAAAVVTGDILPQLVYSLAEQNR